MVDTAKSRKARLKHLEMKLRQTIRKFGLLEPGEHVLVAVSGGPDSVALLLSLHRIRDEFGIRLSVGHCNHGIRGDESDADEEFVRRLCQQLEIPARSESVSVEPNRGNLEQRLRRVRYRFLGQVQQEVGADKIALGHTMDDQAETVLMRLFRGSGTDGLSAIHPSVNDLYVRPLLECSRQEVLRYLHSRDARFRDDATNSDMRFERNRLRQELIPYLQETFNPRIVTTLAKEAAIYREAAEYLNLEAERLFAQLRSVVSGQLALPAAAILALPPVMQKLVLRRAVETVRGSLKQITESHLSTLKRLCLPNKSGRRVRLPRGSVAWREFEWLVFHPAELPPATEYTYQLTVPGFLSVPEANLDFRATATGGGDLAKLPRTSALLRFDQIPQSLVVRSRQRGDRYGNRDSKKVKKMLIDARIHQAERGRLPMVVADGIVLWIPGFPTAKSFTPSTRSDRCVLVETSSTRSG